jgi:hypothetical protein
VTTRCITCQGHPPSALEQATFEALTWATARNRGARALIGGTEPMTWLAESCHLVGAFEGGGRAVATILPHGQRLSISVQDNPDIRWAMDLALPQELRVDVCPD